MAINKKGERAVRVDGEAYRWTIRPQPGKCQGLCESSLTVAVELAAEGKCVLVVNLDAPRPDNWMVTESVYVRRKDVVRYVRGARAAGWQPATPGGPFHYRPGEP